ncbi:MAG TPA: sigma-54-dependent Fis family transcriptional regulator, partial [Tistrella mobilis]|nr:sigma-54-dependent Fis family transcriptional regulator [Tistrella mobilis]
GNVRELENTMHRAVLLARGTEIGAEAIMLADGTSLATAAARRQEFQPQRVPAMPQASVPSHNPYANPYGVPPVAYGQP